MFGPGCPKCGSTYVAETRVGTIGLVDCCASCGYHPYSDDSDYDDYSYDPDEDEDE